MLIARFIGYLYCYLNDGEYTFIMYDTWGEKLVTEGVFTFYSYIDSSMYGSYTIYKDNGSFIHSEGKIFGKIDHEKGNAEFTLGTGSIFDAKIKINKTMDLIDGKWEINARSGRFVAFQKSKTL